MSTKISARLEEMLKALTEDEIRALYEPISEEVTNVEAPLVEGSEQTTALAGSGPVLRGEIKRTCYAVYAKYQCHAWVEDNGTPYNVDEISAVMNSGNGNFAKNETNSSSLKKLDEVYSYGNACQSARMTAKARKWGASAAVEVRLK
jgi:hypothetical protein